MVHWINYLHVALDRTIISLTSHTSRQTEIIGIQMEVMGIHLEIMGIHVEVK